VKYLVQAGLLVWFYVTPVIYPLAEVGGLRPWIEANPASGVVQLFRAATVGADAGWGTSVAWAFGWSVVTLAAAVALHRRHDRVFVDLL
jgi:ABC-type polysaccharide/polyol phosphate export permease